MGATATQPPVAATASDNVQQIREDVVVGKENNKEGKPEPTLYGLDSVNAADFKTAHPSFSEAFRATVQKPKPRNYAGIHEVFGENEEEAASSCYRGIVQKLNNRLPKILLDTDEDGNFTFPTKVDELLTNGVLDLTEEARSESKRKVLTEEEKMIKALSPQNDAIALVTFNAWRSAMGMQPVAVFPRG